MELHLPSMIIASSVSYVLALTNNKMNAPSRCSTSNTLLVMFIQVLIIYCRFSLMRWVFAVSGANNFSFLFAFACCRCIFLAVFQQELFLILILSDEGSKQNKKKEYTTNGKKNVLCTDDNRSQLK